MDRARSVNVRDLLSELAGRTGKDARRGRGARRPLEAQADGRQREAREMRPFAPRIRARSASTCGREALSGVLHGGPQVPPHCLHARPVSRSAIPQPGAGRKGDRATAAAPPLSEREIARRSGPSRTVVRRIRANSRWFRRWFINSEITGWVVARPFELTQGNALITRREGGERVGGPPGNNGRSLITRPARTKGSSCTTLRQVGFAPDFATA